MLIAPRKAGLRVLLLSLQYKPQGMSWMNQLVLVDLEVLFDQFWGWGCTED